MVAWLAGVNDWDAFSDMTEPYGEPHSTRDPLVVHVRVSRKGKAWSLLPATSARHNLHNRRCSTLNGAPLQHRSTNSRAVNIYGRLEASLDRCLSVYGEARGTGGAFCEGFLIDEHYLAVMDLYGAVALKLAHNLRDRLTG